MRYNIQYQMNMDNQDIIDSFFRRDGQTTPNGSLKRSVILALEKDLGFCILLPKVWTNPSSVVQMTPQQYSAMQAILPTFTVMSLFCTAVDVLARVTHKNAIPPRGQNSIYFTNCARSWFHFTPQESRALWQLRNGVSHGYHLLPGYAARQFGHGKVMLRRQDGTWEFYLHAMFTALQNAKREIYDHLSSENAISKQQTAEYLTSNGFFYSR